MRLVKHIELEVSKASVLAGLVIGGIIVSITLKKLK